ncbi:MAG: glycine cleavage system aminomethyltransferase GcvT [Pirellulales bacterium]
MTASSQTTSTELARTALYDWHVAHGGRMVDFGGWLMPMQYSSIIKEHQITRTAAGLFDISHMGRLHFSGTGVAEFLDSLLTRRVIDMHAGQICYSLICNQQGGILDDVLIYCLDNSNGDDSEQQSIFRPKAQLSREQNPSLSFQMVVNASNRKKIVDWLTHHLVSGELSADSQIFDDVQFQDLTHESAMIAVQGPKAIALLDPLLDCNLKAIRYYRGMPGQFSQWPCYITRTGYTGEDGCELIVANEDGPRTWETILERGNEMGISPIGLAARDTLRLEAAMPLYGHELSEQTNPIQAGLGFALNLKNREFIGRDAIVNFQTENRQPMRIGLQLDGKRVPREGHVILQAGQPIGEVTSGTYSPTFERPIAMGYVKKVAGAPGTTLSIDIRGKHHPAVVIPLPFYTRGKP